MYMQCGLALHIFFTFSIDELKNIHMNADFGTIVVLFFLIFGALELSIIIIPAIIRMSVAERRYQPVYDIPLILSRPVPAENIAVMRSWYFDKNDPHQYIRKIAVFPHTPVNSRNMRDESSVFSEIRGPLRTDPEKDWKTINKANRAIKEANKAVREANHKLSEAKVTIEQAGEEDFAGMDEIAELDLFGFQTGKK
jgi:hypothetical protein